MAFIDVRTAFDVPAAHRPDWNVDVLKPLRAAQAQEQVEAEEQAAEAAEMAQTASPAPTVAYDEPDDWYKAFIYNHESGNDPTKWNSSGCLGLGQACPASKLLAVCPDEDYACEDQFFTDYMFGRYGSWQAAYAFWIRTDARPYPGNWW